MQWIWFGPLTEIMVAGYVLLVTGPSFHGVTLPYSHTAAEATAMTLFVTFLLINNSRCHD
jgi:hypothetical protein